MSERTATAAGSRRAVRLSADPATLVFVLAGLIGGLVAAVLGIGGSPWALTVGAFVSGGIAFGCGLIEVSRGWFGANQATFVRLMGLSLTVFGVGQMMFGTASLLGTPRFPTPGDGIAGLAVPLAFAAVLAMPRAGRHNNPAVRLGLDSALLGPAAALLIWELGLADRVAERMIFSPPVLGLVVAMVGVLTLLSLVMLVWVREPGLEIACVSAGIATFVVGELLALYVTLGGAGRWPWEAPVLWCLGWSLIAVGLPRMHRAVARHIVPRPEVADPDARVVTVTTSLCLGFLAVGLLAMMWRAQADTVALVLVLIAVGLFWGREMLDARLRAILLHRLEEEAMTDPLTAIANRRTLTAHIAELCPDEPWCLLSVDLDGFKEVNDLLGHAVGDRLLRAVADRLRAAVPEDAVVSRMGGDEFAILLRGDVGVATEAGRRVVAAVRRSAGDVDGVNRVEVTASVGVTEVFGPPETSRHASNRDLSQVDPLGALSAAGIALRAAKEAGRDRIKVYDAPLAKASRRRLLVEERLRAAVQARAIEVHFQPIVDLRENRLAGAEALARWRDPVLGPVSPAEFIPIAEQSRLIADLGEHVLFSALRMCSESGYFDEGLRVSVNVSPVQLRAPGLDLVVEQALHEFAVEPQQVVVEITESVVVEDGPAMRTLRRLADLGVTVAIDDFGTGYSAMGYLRRLPAKMLKIDRSMTSGVTFDRQSRALVGAIVDLARAVDLEVVVEGVEDADVSDLALDMGATYAQGLWFGDAMTVEDLVLLAQDRIDSPMRRRPPSRRLA